MSDSNPYSAPVAGKPAPEAPAAVMPIYCKVVFIIDLVLCCLRVPLVGLSVIGFIAIQQGAADGGVSPGAALAEVLTGLGIAGFGIVGNSFLLQRKSWALPFGWLNLFATIGSTFTGLWELIEMSEGMGEGPEAVGMMIGGTVSVLVRVGLLLAYGAALVVFQRWAAERESQGPGLLGE